MRNNLKRIMTITVMLSMAICVCAQKNMIRGYIITLEGDTINGTIDFQSREKSAHFCVFKANGDDTFQSYMPTQILGYRLADKKVVFVSRKFPVNNQDQWIFAEILVQGGISLYRYETTWTDVTYYFVNEKGELAVLKDPGVHLKYETGLDANVLYGGVAKSPGELEYYDADDAFDIKLKALKPAMAIFAESDQAKEELWNKPITANNLVRITRKYNKKYFPESEADAFEYDAAKSSAVDLHLYAEGGAYFGSVDLGMPTHPSISGLHLGIGGEWLFPRVNNHFSMQALLMLNIGKADNGTHLTTVNQVLVETPFNKMTFYDLNAQIGVNYRIVPQYRLTPIICGGLLLRAPICSIDGSSHFLPQNDSSSILPMDFGCYIGGGIETRIGKQRLSATAKYELPISNNYYAAKGIIATLGITL